MKMELTEDDARNLLEEKEAWLIKDMIERGWGTIDEAVIEFEGRK